MILFLVTLCPELWCGPLFLIDEPLSDLPWLLNAPLDGEFVISHAPKVKGNKGEMIITETNYSDIKANVLTQQRGDKTYSGYTCLLEDFLQICQEKNEL